MSTTSKFTPSTFTLANAGHSTIWRAILLRCCAATLVVFSLGCTGYQIGHRTLYRPDIRTVHVPIFRSESLRRHLGERLTEAVVKEIESTTPYKVVGGGNADSVLTGRIVRETKSVKAENRFDDIREASTNFTVDIQWLSRNGELLVQRSGMPMNFLVDEQAIFIPEAGQSIHVAQQQAITRLAKEIVGQMEMDW